MMIVSQINNVSILVVLILVFLTIRVERIHFVTFTTTMHCASVLKNTWVILLWNVHHVSVIIY